MALKRCTECGKVVSKQTVDNIVDSIMALPEGTKLQIMAPVVRGKKGNHNAIWRG